MVVNVFQVILAQTKIIQDYAVLQENVQKIRKLFHSFIIFFNNYKIKFEKKSE